MNSVSGIFVALAFVFGGGYALDRIYVATKRAAVERIHHGMPHLSDFTARLTCGKLNERGEFHHIPCKRR